VARWVRPDAVPAGEDPAAWARRRLAEARREQRERLEGQRRRLLGHIRRAGGDLAGGFGRLLAEVEAELAGLPPDDDEPGEVRPPATVSRVRLRRHGSQHANG
jgi:hypothetical protein